MSNLVKATFIILVMNLLSRFLGFVRDAVIASKFGASGATDAYMVAYTLPFSLQAVLGMAFVSVIVPAVTGYIMQDRKDEGWQIVSSMLNGTAVVLGILTIVGMIFAPQLVNIMAPGFNEETVSLTAHLARIMFPSIIFMGLGMLLTGVLNAGQKFTIPAFAPGFANIIIILAVILFGSTFLIDGLAYGTLFGFIGFLLIQIPSLRKIGFKYNFSFDFRNPHVRKLSLAVLPVSFSVAVNQILLALNRFFASHLMPGSITALDFANRVMNLPLGIFVAAITTSIFPLMSENAANKDFVKLAKNISNGLATVTVIIIPVAIGMIILRVPFLKLLFERGEFTAENTALTATALLYFCLGLWFIALNYILTRAFYALGDLKTPTILGGICIIFNIIFSILLIPVLGHGGLALANTLAQGINAFQLYFSLQKRIKNIDIGNIGKITAKTILSAGIMGGIIWILLPFIVNIVGNSTLGLLIQLIGLATIGCIIFIIMIFVLKINEAKWFINLFLKKFNFIKTR